MLATAVALVAASSAAQPSSLRVERFPIVVRTLRTDGHGGSFLVVQAFVRLSRPLPRRADGSSRSSSVRVDGRQSDATVSRVGASRDRWCYATGSISSAGVRVGQRVRVTVHPTQVGAVAATAMATVRGADVSDDAPDVRDLIGCGGRKPRG